MKILGPASEGDLPAPLREALFSRTGAAYCMYCDGLRAVGHECVNPFTGQARHPKPVCGMAGPARHPDAEELDEHPLPVKTAYLVSTQYMLIAPICWLPVGHDEPHDWTMEEPHE